MQYLVTFERIGRNRNLPPLSVEAANADAIAEAVWRAARKHLGSRFYDVDVNLETGIVWIEGDWFGSGTVAPVPA